MKVSARVKAVLFAGVASSFVLAFCFRSDRHLQVLAAQEKPMVIIIPSYNNARWYAWNVDSVLNQNYTNFRVIYIDDCSTDGTYELVNAHIQKSIHKDKVTLIKNEQRQGALANLYYAIHSLEGNVIVVTVDGDDWLNGSDVLKKVNDAYKDANVWLTYGQFEEYPRGSLGICREIEPQVIDGQLYRKAPWVTSHLRTFYAWLFKRVKKEDLQFNGQFLGVTWDQAFMYPMLEMAHGRHKFISEILYIYNQANPLNDFKVRLREQMFFARVLSNKPKYEPLSSADIPNDISQRALS